MTPLVSVCIPAYNNPEGLYNTLDCICRQSYKNLEIIISINPSPDPVITKKMLTIAGNFERFDTRIEIYQQEHYVNVDINYRFVIDKARGKYFMFAQDDDWWSRDFIKNLVAGLEAHPESPAAICPVRYIIGKEKQSELHDMKHLSVYSTTGSGDMGFVCMGIWKTNRFKNSEVRLPIYVLGGDHITVAQAILAYGKIVIVDSELYLKGFKEGRFQVCFNLDFWYSFRSWYWLMKTLIQSQIIPWDRKLILPVVAATNLFRASAITGVQIVLMLPESNPIRKKVQQRFFGAN
jgi:glycosyltransferase involved in cell wall biosynthesis